MASIDDRKFLKRLGDRIRKQREVRALTQQQLGDFCELDRTFIGSVERGERNVSILNLRKITQVLRITLADLFE